MNAFFRLLSGALLMLGLVAIAVQTPWLGLFIFAGLAFLWVKS